MVFQQTNKPEESDGPQGVPPSRRCQVFPRGVQLHQLAEQVLVAFRQGEGWLRSVVAHPTVVSNPSGVSGWFTLIHPTYPAYNLGCNPVAEWDELQSSLARVYIMRVCRFEQKLDVFINQLMTRGPPLCHRKMIDERIPFISGAGWTWGMFLCSNSLRKWAGRDV